MSKIVSMSSGAIDPINVTKRVFWRPVTSTTVLKVGQPVCYNSDCVCDHKERTGDPTHLGLTIDTYAEGEQEFTGRLFIVEEPLTANLMSFAGICKSLGPKAGADGDMIEIFTPVPGAVVPVYTDENCVMDRTILGIHNAEVDVSYPGVAIGVAKETKDRSSTDGMVWMEFKNFISDNANATLQVDDEANAVDVNGVYKINVEFLQTSGNACALWVQGKSSAGAVANGYGLAAYFQADITGTVASHVAGVGIWMNVTGGTPAQYLTALQVGLYEDGATMSSTAGRVSVLTLTMQVADDVTANSLGWLWLEQNGAQAADALILSSNLAALPATAFTGSTTINTDSYGIKVYLANQPGTQQWYIPLIPKLAD